MDTTNINNIKKKLKEDYNFIKNDGAILTNIARDLLTENDNDYQKTVEFIDTLSKKDIQNRMQKIMNDLETSGEISSLVKETIKKDTLKLDKLKQSLEGLENEYSELEDSKTELEKSIKDLQDKLELKEIEITSKIKSDQDKHDSHLASLENILTEKKIELVDIQNTLDSVFQNGYENEFNYLECDYIKKEPVIHLKNNFIIKDISLNFPILEKLEDYEYIIKYYYLNINTPKKDNSFVNFSSQYNFEKCIFVLYITNYGRLIKSNIANFYIGKLDLGTSMGGHRGYYFDVCLNPIINISGNNLVSYSKSIYVESDQYNAWGKSTINQNIYDSREITQVTKLNYRMPRIFLDVIDAFHTQNNDLMQECCKKYLSITRTKGTDEQIIDNIEFDRIIRDKDLIITEKDKIIENNNKHIEEQNNEIEKMKQEIAKLKSALSVFVS